MRCILYTVIVALFWSGSFSFGATFVPGQNNGSANPDSARIINAIDSIVQRYDSISSFNGIIALVSQDELPVLYIKGYKDPVVADLPLTASDLFHLASVSKCFTGLATLTLMEEYDLQPADPIGTYFPELQPALGRVTIRQLANHTSGIHDYLSLTGNHHYLTNEDVLKLLRSLDTTVFIPDSRWGYTNSGYVLLALLTERISGISFENYLRQKVTEPLGLHNLKIRPDRGVLSGYYGDAVNTVLGKTTGDAGLYTSARDMLAFCRNRSVFTTLYSRARQWSSPWHDPAWTYGFGWFFASDARGAFQAHSGQAEGFQTYIRIYDNNGPALFILSNCHSTTAKPLREELIRHLLLKEN